MKKYGMIALVLLLMFSMSACRFGRNDTATDTGNQQTDNMTLPTIIDPTMIDPTMGTNIPDPDVDNDHMIDDTMGDSQDSNGNLGEDYASDATDPLSRIRRSMK